VDPASVLNPVQYRLTGTTSGAVAIRAVSYDSASRTAGLTVDALLPDTYQLQVLKTVESQRGVAMAEDYSSSFVAVSDFSALVRFEFFNSRMLRSAGTISYDVTITNITSNDLLLPLVLVLDPARNYSGVPEDALPRDDSGVFFIDLSGSLPEQGRLRPNQTTLGRTVTIRNPTGQRVDLGHGVFTLPYPNEAPEFTSTPVAVATVGQPYSYQAVAKDPDGVALVYLLIEGPLGMSVDPASGLVTWTPAVTDPAAPNIVLHAYDARGGAGKQEFAIDVSGVNRPPVLEPPPKEITGFEGRPIDFALEATTPKAEPWFSGTVSRPGRWLIRGRVVSHGHPIFAPLALMKTSVSCERRGE
jgi:hypothetical protein